MLTEVQESSFQGSPQSAGHPQADFPSLICPVFRLALSDLTFGSGQQAIVMAAAAVKRLLFRPDTVHRLFKARPSIGHVAENDGSLPVFLVYGLPGLRSIVPSSPYGFLILRLNASEITARQSSSRNGAMKPPEDSSSLLAAVAMKAAPIRLKFITEKFRGKCFAP